MENCGASTKSKVNTKTKTIEILKWKREWTRENVCFEYKKQTVHQTPP